MKRWILAISVLIVSLIVCFVMEEIFIIENISRYWFVGCCAGLISEMILSSN